jgi:predicted dehydrogenase
MIKKNKKQILIFGAGSIGNHMSFASRNLNYNVNITDISKKALVRMKKEIYPKRYKNWDSKIRIVPFSKVFDETIVYDLIIIGTPPSSHTNLFLKIIKNIKYKKILIEKPLCTYLDKKTHKLLKLNKKNIFCGYNHSISKSFDYFLKNLKFIRNEKVIKVDWKEGWDGILSAHFWMKSEFSTYLGNLKEGGGSLHEHSHGLHLMLIILKKLRINIDNSLLSSSILFKEKYKKKYDEYSHLIGKYKSTYFRYETDLITSPSNKGVLVANNKKSIELIFNYKPNIDAVIKSNDDKKIVKIFKKSRSSEFENELKYIINIKRINYKNSYLNLNYAIKVMKIIRKILVLNER